MTQAQFDASILALALWREARGQGTQGMTAVGCCLRTRKVNTKDPWSKVLEEKNQLSSLTVHSDPETTLWPDPRDPTWLEALRLVDGILDGTTADTTNGAMFYANLSVATSPWFQEHVVDDKLNHPLCARIGAHSFFK